MLYFFLLRRYGPIAYGCDFGGVHAYLIVGDDESKVFDLRLMKRTLFWFKEKVVFTENPEYISYNSFVMRVGFREDEYVVHID